MNKRIRLQLCLLLVLVMGSISERISAEPSCTFPNLESNVSDGAGTDPARTVSATRFNVTISNAQGSIFNSRTVTEYSPVTGTNGCWYTGAPYDRYPVISGGTWTVAGGQVAGQTNHYGWDYVGWTV